MLVQFLLSVGLLAASFAAVCPSEDIVETVAESVESPEESVESPAAPVASPTWTLRYKFVPDQKLRYRNTENVTLDAMLSEIRKVDVTAIEQRRIFTVATVDDAGAARLTMQYEFVGMRVQTNEYEPVMFDTTMQPADIPPAFRNTARQLKGSAPRFWISSLGNALQKSDSAGGYAPAGKAVAQAGNVIVGDKSSAPRTDTVQQAVDTSTPKSAEASDAVTFLMPLPENPVAVGDTWREMIPVNVRVTEEISRQINILRTFRLESVETGVATISFRSSVEAAVKSPTMRAQLIKATPKGTLTLDIERGVMVKREIRYDETVLNALGPNSVVLCHGSSTEELLKEAATAAKN
ncbi:MAG: DUF6263 family protein [Planctomycetaceae bacterium]